ncbi:MAG: oxygenase MpaB family protein [Pseudolabrys sp.]|nr:oxygenase MpaB family protein [Pseudolabrys sp.]
MTALAPSPINLPWPLNGWLEQSVAEQLAAPGLPKLDLTRPKGEAALVPADSISWRIFKNPVSLFIGGVSAVILELAEPRVRSGVWDHTTFRKDPLTRLRRTGAAAMITVYGARSQAEAMIGGVVRRHGHVSGVTPAGVAYNANDAVLLDWVQATASFGFIESYSRFARRLSCADEDRAYAEAVDGAALYGAMQSPSSRAELDAQFEQMRPHLENHTIVHEFLDIMQRAPVLPPLLKPVQKMLVRAAVDMLPRWTKALLHLEDAGLNSVERSLVRRAGAFADRVVIPNSPAAQASARLGLPADYVYRR